MKRSLWVNIGMNLFLAALFVALNIRSLTAGLEETFVALALIYGALTVFFNAICVALATRQPKEQS